MHVETLTYVQDRNYLTQLPRAPSTKSSMLRGTLLHKLYLAQAGMRHGKCAPEGIDACFSSGKEEEIHIYIYI